MTPEQLALLTLLVTIVGWAVTAFYQRRLLERQISADKDAAKRELLIPRYIQDLSTIRSWLEEGYRLWRLREHIPFRDDLKAARQVAVEKRALDEHIATWAAQHGSISTLARLVDRKIPATVDDDVGTNLNLMISRIYLNMPTVNLAYDEDERFPDGALRAYLDYFEPCIRRIERLIELEIRGDK